MVHPEPILRVSINVLFFSFGQLTALSWPEDLNIRTGRPMSVSLLSGKCDLYQTVLFQGPQMKPKAFGINGTPGGIRTPDLLLRRQPLYPSELQAH
jgi:hypothetical protein